MPVYAIGDIHGCSNALRVLLEAVRPGPNDMVVTLGDYVDVGPDVPGALDRLLELRRETRVVAMRGNHDQMMLDARAGSFALELWRSIGGAATLHAYGGSLDSVPDEHWAFLDSTRDWYETLTHLYVHGGLDADLALPEQCRQLLHWASIDSCRPHGSGKTIVCGHTRQESGIPLNIGHAVCIDTGAAEGGWLTCLDVDHGTGWQASETGETRTLTRADLRRAG